MTTEILRKKTGRYISGQSFPAEIRQIQNWLSSTGDKKTNVSAAERLQIENEIVAQINAYVVSSQFLPKQDPWWKKITTFF